MVFFAATFFAATFGAAAFFAGAAAVFAVAFLAGAFLAAVLAEVDMFLLPVFWSVMYEYVRTDAFVSRRILHRPGEFVRVFYAFISFLQGFFVASR